MKTTETHYIIRLHGEKLPTKHDTYQDCLDWIEWINSDAENLRRDGLTYHKATITTTEEEV